MEEEEEKKKPPGGLLGLPGELRNHIFELAFTDNKNFRIDLLAAEPPSKDLLFTCRQIYSDAKGLFKTAYQNYWTKNTFLLHLPRREHVRGLLTMEQFIEDFPDTELNHIQRLIVYGFGDVGYMCYRLIGRHEGWKFEAIVEGAVQFSYLRLRTAFAPNDMRSLSGRPFRDVDDVETLAALRELQKRDPSPALSMKDQLIEMVGYGSL